MANVEDVRARDVFGLSQDIHLNVSAARPDLKVDVERFRSFPLEQFVPTKPQLLHGKRHSQLDALFGRQPPSANRVPSAKRVPAPHRPPSCLA